MSRADTAVLLICVAVAVIAVVSVIVGEVHGLVAQVTANLDALH